MGFYATGKSFSMDGWKIEGKAEAKESPARACAAEEDWGK